MMLSLLLNGCVPQPGLVTGSQINHLPLVDKTPAAVPAGNVPVFSHIVIIMLENRSYDQVIGSPDMPNLNGWASQYTLLTRYYAIRHPSLPNYLAITGGDTFGIASDCTGCFINQTSLPDLIEKSGRTWKTYQEGMPSPCYIGNSGEYVQKHDPFIYFDPIRTDSARCQQSVVPFTQLESDLSANELPDYAFIMPDLCNSGHNCGLKIVDAWLKKTVDLLEGSPALGDNSLIVITFDEGSVLDGYSQAKPENAAGGHIATVLISPLVKTGFQDDTSLSHYSLLKTILAAWGLPNLNHTSDLATHTIEAPWK